MARCYNNYFAIKMAKVILSHAVIFAIRQIRCGDKIVACRNFCTIINVTNI